MPLPASSHLEEAQFSPLTSQMHRAYDRGGGPLLLTVLLLNNPPDVMLKQKDQKDAELDKKIVALRKKNEALMKRYQEVEEDKKRAEQEGMSYTPRKDKAEDLTITIKKSPHETRVVKKKQGTGCPPSPRGVSELEDADVKDLLTLGRGKRMQLLVTMANKTKGKRIVSEKQGLNCPSSPGGLKDFNNEEEHRLSVGRGKQIQLTKTPNHRAKKEEGTKNLNDESEWLAQCHLYYKHGRAEKGPGWGFSDNLQQPEVESDQKNRGRGNARKSGGSNIDNIAQEFQKLNLDSEQQDARWHEPKSPADLSVPTSRQEQEEYSRWKKEREQIDRERVARHKNTKGEWKRAWDVDKAENMYGEQFLEEVDPRVGRNASKFRARFPNREARCGMQRSGGKGWRVVPTVSSKAKGKDRLTGRAKRWDSKEKEEHLQAIEKFSKDFKGEEDPETWGDPEVDEILQGWQLNRDCKENELFHEKTTGLSNGKTHKEQLVQGIPKPKNVFSENLPELAFDMEDSNTVLKEEAKANGRMMDGDAILQTRRGNVGSSPSETYMLGGGSTQKTHGKASVDTGIVKIMENDLNIRSESLTEAQEHLSPQSLHDCKIQENDVSSAVQGADLTSSRKLNEETGEAPVLTGTAETEKATQSYEFGVEVPDEPGRDCTSDDSHFHLFKDEKPDANKKNNPRSVEGSIESSVFMMGSDSGAPLTAPEASSVKAEELGKVLSEDIETTVL
ncbi:uncharacterized protein LOC121329979 isoform X3 [Polyodon spathula]|uniref:uncharacterized protein LOC121329979 isoform X3 n=1 Tax=Polyodon spathula TaxID=7913 RepID=UPI001B7F0078|nr:uncharacterized protein LOC121329979 isoform X3 [Polyodon spathula]XP_041132078.1 uncharacterized protein LOC121329979 isoform X3 [Polyodon spathula]XP_041132079.1 uncharacterized protein LOC121329979 isoform X3 [Polyodon spathula]